MTPDVDRRSELARTAGRNPCITCGDEALPLTVVEVDAGRELALCEAEDGRRATVEIALVTPVERGDVLLVHAGTAIAHGAPA